MDHIDTTLTNQARDDKFDEALQAAVGIAKKTLNRYYKLSDLSATYRMAMSKYCIIFRLHCQVETLRFSPLTPAMHLASAATRTRALRR